MPLVEVSLAAGRSPQQVRDLVHALHEAVVRSVGAAPDNVTVVVREVPRDHWSRGDVTLAELDARAAPPSDTRPAPTPAEEPS